MRIIERHRDGSDLLHVPAARKDLHVDYAFATNALLDGSAIALRHPDEWRTRSDHLPLIIDLP